MDLDPLQILKSVLDRSQVDRDRGNPSFCQMVILEYWTEIIETVFDLATRDLIQYVWNRGRRHARFRRCNEPPDP